MTNSNYTFKMPADQIYLSDVEIQAHKMRAEAFAVIFASLSTAVSKAVSGAVSWVRNKLEISRIQSELYAMDDRLLDDIGVTRGDIEAILNGSLNREPLQPVASNIEFIKKTANAQPATTVEEDTRIAA